MQTQAIMVPPQSIAFIQKQSIAKAKIHLKKLERVFPRKNLWERFLSMMTYYFKRKI